MECVIETKASTILQFFQGLSGSLQVTLEEGTWAAWLYDLLKPHVTNIVVCNPRRNALLKEGSKSDRIDARKLAELLRLNSLRPVYHGEHGVRTLKELARSYLTISKDLGRVMSRVKAIYRSWGIPCTGKQVYAPRYRSEWLGKIEVAGVRRRAEFSYQQLDALRPLRQQVRQELLAEAKKHDAWKLLRAAAAGGTAATPGRPTFPAGGETAYIGKSLLIKGEVSGSEPIHIEGRIEGSISLPGGHVSVGREGVVTSSVHAGEVIIRGTLQGNITASDRVEIDRGGNVIGEVVTQRISIEDGAQMKGTIKMGRPDPKGHLEIHDDTGSEAQCGTQHPGRGTPGAGCSGQQLMMIPTSSAGCLTSARKRRRW